MSSPDPSPLLSLLARWEMEKSVGHLLSPEDLCRDHPALLDEVRKQLAKLQAFPVHDTVDSTKPFDAAPHSAITEEPPIRIGRYRIDRVLGKGGFGLVYLAHDDQLHRLVAIKVPHRSLVYRQEDAEAYLNEARTVANLDHPNIVPVYDVGSSEEYPCFIVSKFIEGSTLAEKIQTDRPAYRQAAELVATIAEALHYAHRKGLVHRDIKPGNILLDTSGKPFVVDFGLALKEENLGQGPKYAGTPAYMSPEQARGEGHRVDGRSDIFSLGVTIFEMLTGRKPFRADTQAELLEQITSFEPRPPRQYDDAIPKELERICLKTLSKRASERYTTARDLVDDLRHFLAQLSGLSTQNIDFPAITPILKPPSTQVASGTAGSTSLTPASDSKPIKIVPKGLRSFDAHDADFFLELLPGPRDRDGLPDSLRFWKTRIEETDTDNTFSVGLIYGPSGCGKSSLVKAGLLPRLFDNVIIVYVEATADETETRLLNGLRKRCPALPENPSLKETLAALRRGQGIPVGKKVVIILDQFEQWLHAKKEETDTELIQALRQCDGGRVQCIVMVRDDFWMAATRFMRELEVHLVEGQNSAAVDLFPIRHAEKVLAAFGRAFGVLPDTSTDTSKDQKLFLEQAVNGLAQEGKVICVRLALFAEMMKSKAWTPASLKAVGGTEGVGVTFLEETFSAASAPPEHRYHQKAARADLKALLPETGSDIKGHMRSYDELLEASGYGSRPKDFDDLIRILDSEIRLITPTDPEGKEESSVSSSLPGQKYYQLTHDYLVHSLREWLTRKQKETRRGRAELLLADRAGVWNTRPENRQLPSLWQWARIRWLTAKKNWTLPQQKMMSKATRYHVSRGLLVALILALIGFGSWEGYGRMEARRLRDRLVESATADVPGILCEIAGYRRWVNPLVREAYIQAEKENDPRKQLRASLALLPTDTGQVEYLSNKMLQAEPQEVVLIRNTLLEQKADLTDRWWKLIADPITQPGQRLRAAVALSAFAPNDARWEMFSNDVATTLVSQEPFVIALWTDALKGVKLWLIPRLAVFLTDEKLTLPSRGLIAKVYGSYAADSPDTIVRLEKELEESFGVNSSEDTNEKLIKKQASLGAALMVLGRCDKIWPLLKHSADPTLRTYLIDRFAPSGFDCNVLITRLGKEQEASIKRAILLSIGDYRQDLLSQVDRRNLVPQLLQLYKFDPDPGVHSAAELLLRKWQATDELKIINMELSTGKVEGNRLWYLNRQGFTMNIIPKTEEFWMGEGKDRHRRQIDRNFGLASKEVTVNQFLRFRNKHAYNKDAASTLDCPVNMVSWYDATEFCNWLSEQEGIPKEQWCYIPNKDGKYDVGMTMASDYLKKTGYRLPTEAEWEYGCGALTDTIYCHGNSHDMQSKYAWFDGNTVRTSHPAGQLNPNDLGFFDMNGNVWELCQEDYLRYRNPTKFNIAIFDIESPTISINPNEFRVFRGGSFTNPITNTRTRIRAFHVPMHSADDIGFRVARTLPFSP